MCGNDKNHNRDDQIQRLLTLVENLKKESTQNLCRTRQMIEQHNLRLRLDLPYLREDSSGSSTNVGGGLPRGEVAPSRRHSLPVLLSPETPRESKDWLQVSQNNNNNSPTVLKNRSHIEFPTNFFASARASIPMCNGRLPVRDPFDDVYDVEIAVTKPMVTFDLDSLESSAI